MAYRNWTYGLGIAASLLLAGTGVTQAETAPATATATATATAGKPVKGGELRIAIPEDIGGTQPGITDNGSWHVVQHHLAESLVAYREDLSVGPALAKSYSASPDGKSFTFVLRDSVKFHDGSTLTADDVKWAFDNIYLNEKTHWECRPFYDGTGNQAERNRGVKITSIEVKDPKTIVFKLEQPSGVFLSILADIDCFPAIVSRKSFKPDGSWDKPIGTGPYQLDQWEKGKSVTLKRFEGYAPSPEKGSGFVGARIAYLDTLRFVVVPKDNVPTAFNENQIDFAHRISEEKYNALSDVEGITVSFKPNGTEYAILMQNADPLLKDIRIRRAIAHAIDTKELAHSTTQGRTKPNPSAIPDMSVYHTKAHEVGYKFDPELSKKLLKEAKYNGAPIKLEANRDRYPLMYPNALLVKRMLEAVGFKIDLVERPWDEQLRNYNEGNFQLQSFAYSGRRYPEANFDHFAGRKSLRKSVQWDTDRANELMDKARFEPDLKKRQKIYDELHKAMIEDVPLVWLNQWELRDALRTNVHGYVPWALNEARFWGVWKDPS